MNIDNVECFHDMLMPMIRPRYWCHTALFGQKAWLRLVRAPNAPIPDRVWRRNPTVPELIEANAAPPNSLTLIGEGPNGQWTHYFPSFSIELGRGMSIPEVEGE